MAKRMDPEIVSWATSKGYTPEEMAMEWETVESEYKKAHPKKRGRKGGTSLSDSLQKDSDRSDRETSVTLSVFRAADGDHLKTLSGLSNKARAGLSFQAYCLTEDIDPKDCRVVLAEETVQRTVYQPTTGTVFTKD